MGHLVGCKAELYVRSGEQNAIRPYRELNYRRLTHAKIRM